MFKFMWVCQSSKLKTLAWGSGLRCTDVNPYLLQSHAASQLSHLHDAGPTPPLAFLEPIPLTLPL
jgi:hypothetical protein